jgi:hypothetical protein
VDAAGNQSSIASITFTTPAVTPPTVSYSNTSGTAGTTASPTSTVSAAFTVTTYSGYTLTAVEYRLVWPDNVVVAESSVVNNTATSGTLTFSISKIYGATAIATGGFKIRSIYTLSTGATHTYYSQTITIKALPAFASFSASSLNLGNITYNYSVTDADANLWYIDLYANGGWYKRVGLSGGATGPLSTTYYGIAAGSYTAYAIAVDADGQGVQSNTTASFTVATNGALPVFASFSASSSSAGTITYNYSVTDAKGYLWYMDMYTNAGWCQRVMLSGGATGNLSTTVSGVAAGSYTAYAIAIDGYGQGTESNTTASFTVNP